MTELEFINALVQRIDSDPNVTYRVMKGDQTNIPAEAVLVIPTTFETQPVSIGGNRRQVPAARIEVLTEWMDTPTNFDRHMQQTDAVLNALLSDLTLGGISELVIDPIKFQFTSRGTDRIFRTSSFEVSERRATR